MLNLTDDAAMQLAQRAFVKVLLAIAAAYIVIMQVNRDSEDKKLLKAFRRVALKVHPDKAALWHLWRGVVAPDGIIFLKKQSMPVPGS